MDKRYNRRGGKKKIDNYTPTGDSAALATPIQNMGLSERTLSALTAGGVKTAADIARRRSREMYRIQNIGRRNIAEIEKALALLKLTFRPDEQENENAKRENIQGKQSPAENKGGNINANKNSEQQKKSVKQVGRQDNLGKQNNNGNRPNNTKSDIKSYHAINDAISKTYAGMSINEIIMGGKRKRPLPQPAQKEHIKEGDLVKFCRKGKWGYKDWKGNVVIQPSYEEAFSFSEGLAGVEKNGLIGYISDKENLVINYIYDCGTSFKEGLAAVSKGEKSGYIDKKGNVVIDFIYDVATPFDNGRAIVRADERWGVLDRQSLNVLWR